ncbi:ubiquitin carboxyl-terminal hydrolase MINDY-1-like [Impatiens glandulifera]|uniref:ubiquitin carboxyl-terminal hydrolase MINDY-1-like n=1 Tax=Impatiens glandulifera TaxID=253017 RepID=UPI001FB09CDC|nr:ubiquitin carboxyl-terminal hydrolase MINDY-1-like [Impatiens glandulifera]
MGYLEVMHKTKLIQFLGRTTPIILQNDNDNGSSPLLAICNVLLLKNSLNLEPDTAEVSQEMLLSLVAQRLIDSNSNANNKNVGFLANQQRNVADAIDLLPRLASGIDLNIKFRRIDDFEFVRERAIFDLLEIPLYHGWIVNPQEVDTLNAIGSRSHKTLRRELLALEAWNASHPYREDSDEDTVDFVAATTAALGVPSPSISRCISFDASPHNIRTWEMEEEAKLLGALNLSEPESSPASVIDQQEHLTDNGSISPDKISQETVNESRIPDEEISKGHVRKPLTCRTDIRGEQCAEKAESCNFSFHDSEPMYEGEECVLNPTTAQDQEPQYEGEIILAELSAKSSKAEITPREGELIRNFFGYSDTQLTLYGFFCLQNGLKEHEICVFFRNNHFHTMFRFNGELYILATHQVYYDQPDVVWEHLNEVNGNTVLLTADFEEFKAQK